MWKRVCAYLIGIPLAFLGVAYAYSWYTTQSARVEARKLLDEASAQSKALEALGEKNISLVDLTLDGLQARLGRPAMLRPSAHNTSRLGWACGQKDCLIWATFVVPANQEIPPRTLAAGLQLSDPYGSIFGSTERVSIDGAYLGEPMEQLIAAVKKRGYGKDVGHSRITWNGDWSAVVVSAGSSDRVTSLIFLNDSAIAKATVSNETNRN